MLRKPSIATIIFLIASSYVQTSFSAEQDTPTKRETFQVSLGWSVSTYDTDIELSSKNLPIRIPIDFEDDLNFDNQLDFGFIGGHWRFAERHRIRIEYGAFTRKTGKTLEKNIQINDNIIELGASIKSELKTTIYDIDYIYSIYQRPNLEIGLTLGVYWIKTDFNLDASGFVRNADGGDREFDAEYSNKEDLDAPLPLIGARLRYQMTPRWNLTVAARYLSVEIGDYDGRVAGALLAVDYMFSKKFGAGLSVGSLDLKVDADRGSFDGQLNMNPKGVQAFLIYRH